MGTLDGLVPVVQIPGTAEGGSGGVVSELAALLAAPRSEGRAGGKEIRWSGTGVLIRVLRAWAEVRVVVTGDRNGVNVGGN